MKFHFLINIILLIFINNEDIWIWPNIFYMRELYDDETIFFLEIYEPKDDEKMKIELFLSHPSSYQISFNYSDYIEKEEEYEEENINEEKEDNIEENEEEEAIKKEEEKEIIINEEEINNKEKEESINEEEEEEINYNEEEESIDEEEINNNEKEEINDEEEIKKEEEREEEEESIEIENNDESENNLEETIKYLYKNNVFENSLRKLHEYPNDLIESEQEYSNKKTFILNLNKNMTIIHLILKKIKDTPEYITPAIYIKYQCRKKEFKNYIFSNIITTDIINSDVSVTFKGIIPDEENISGEFKVEYEAFLYQKREEEDYENINHIFMPNRYISRSGTIKETNVKEKTFNLLLTGIPQNGNYQWLEVIAEILYGYDREYFVYNITLVYIKDRTNIIPDDNTDNKTDNNTYDKNKTDENDETGDIDDLLFYIIISIFAGVIILIFVIVFVVLKKKSLKNDSYYCDEDDNINILNEENIIN